MLTTKKQCSKCNIIRDFSEFNKSKTAKDGLRCQCKICAKAYRKSNKEAIKRRDADYYIKNKDRINLYREENEDKIKQVRKQYCLANKDKIAMKHKEWEEKNKERRDEYHSQYRKDNKKEIKERCHRFYKNNKEWKKNYDRIYYKEHGDRRREYMNTEQARMIQRNSAHKRRYMRNATSNGSVPIDVKHPLTKALQELLEYQKHKCYLCDCDISSYRHLDHWIPLSKGGTHTIDNVVWLCPKCNLSKSNKMPDYPLSI